MKSGAVLRVEGSWRQVESAVDIVGNKEPDKIGVVGDSPLLVSSTLSAKPGLSSLIRCTPRRLIKTVNVVE
jgi:hypothetical protein